MNEQLSKLAAQINEEKGHLLAAVRTTLERAKRIGELLIQARGIIGRGFNRWVKENCGFCQKTSYNYITIATKWTQIEKRIARKPDLKVSDALRFGVAVDESGEPATTSAAAITASEPEPTTPVESAVVKLQIADEPTTTQETSTDEPADQPVNHEQALRTKIQDAIDALETLTVDDLGRCIIPDDQRTAWLNLAGSLRATAQRIEDYITKEDKLAA